METVVFVFVIALLLAIFLPALAKAKKRSSRISCIYCLKQVGLAYRIWADDNGGLLPMQVPVASGGAMELVAAGNVAIVFQVMSNELSTPKILVCPNDLAHLTATNFTSLGATNISYFVGLTADTNFSANSFLSGDANLTLSGAPVKSGLIKIASNTVVNWDGSRDREHRYYGNLVFADSHVESLSNTKITTTLIGTCLATNRLAIP